MKLDLLNKIYQKELIDLTERLKVYLEDGLVDNEEDIRTTIIQLDRKFEAIIDNLTSEDFLE